MFISTKTKGHVTVDTSKDIFLEGQHLVGASFGGHRASFTPVGCTFERCDFSDVRSINFSFASGKLPTRYFECTFDGARLKRSHPGESRFERCSFRNVQISELFSHAAEFVDCVFSGVLRGVVFYGRVVGNYPEWIDRRTNEFRGNDFSGAKLDDVGFRGGIDLTLQRLPGGDAYLYLPHAAPALIRLREKLLHMPSSTLREGAFQLLKQLEEGERDGQRDLFLARERKPWPTKDAEDYVWRELGAGATS